jgi:hypothetical protein
LNFGVIVFEGSTQAMSNTEKTEILSTILSRRTFGKLVVGSIAYKILSSFLPERKAHAQEFPYSFLDTPPVETQNSEPNAEIQWTWGAEEYAPHPENLVNVNRAPMRGTFPDGSTVMEKIENENIVHYSAGRQQFISTLNSEMELSPATETLRPDRQQTEFGTREYTGVPTIFFIDGKKYGLAHVEHWESAEDGFPFTAQVALVEWNEENQQWNMIDVVINGLDPQVAGERVSGAGQPSAFIEGEHLYTLFIDWDARVHGIHAARVPLSEVTNPEAWQRWNGTDFSQSSLDARFSRVVISPSTNGVYSALPNVITDPNTGTRYVIYEENHRYAIKKLINAATMEFSEDQTLATFPDVENKYNPGHPWYSYPSFIHPEAQNPQEFVTGTPGLFVYSRGWRGSSDGHGMFMKPLTFA